MKLLHEIEDPLPNEYRVISFWLKPINIEYYFTCMHKIN